MGHVSPIAKLARQENEKGTDYWFLSKPSQTILREIRTMKRNHLVILALLFALLPVLSACDSIPMSDDEPEIAGRWVVTEDNVTITLDLHVQEDSNVTGTYTIEFADPGSSGGVISLRGGVTGTYDFPNVTLFVNVFGEDSDRFTGRVNAEGTSLTLVDEEGGEILTLTRQ